ncbi:MAG: Ldh family oxidoreductase [Isosphaeraceae bacterium]|nr:Ldh family oxidoreductase [Isosphaeraceae bacterium]
MEDVRYRLDDLRRFASTLLACAGLAPVRASALATHLLWYEAAGLPEFGLASLAGWLERIEGRAVDPAAEGRVTGEMTGTAVFDGQNGVPPLVLARAAELAMEKARDAGLGLTRVHHLGSAGPVAAIAAELAVGPYVGAVLGHDGSWALALPAPEGLPALFDSSLTSPSNAILPDGSLAWATALVPEGGWLVGAIAVAALEPLGTFHERIGEWLHRQPESAAALLPAAWEARRRAAREHGVDVRPAVWEGLAPWIERAHVARPATFRSADANP